MKSSSRNIEIAAAGLHASPANDFITLDFSIRVLRVLGRLANSFPERSDLTDILTPVPRGDDILRIWSWLREQELVTGQTDSGSLTLTGNRSLRDTMREHPELARSLGEPDTPVHSSVANHLVLAILRAHHSAYLDRAPVSG